MFPYSWNPNIRYRHLHGRHLLIDITKAARVVEISPLLGKLFCLASQYNLESALHLWIDGDALGCVLTREDICGELLGLLVQKELILHDSLTDGRAF